MAQKDFFVAAAALGFGTYRVHLDGGGTTLTADRTLLFDLVDGNRTLSLGGNATFANNFTTSGAFPITLTATASTSVTLPTSGTLAVTGSNTFTGNQAISVAGSASSGSLVFSGTTMNWIDFGTTGVAPPAFTTRSAGTKLVLNNGESGSTVDYAFGIDTSTLWSSVPSTAQSFKWYGGTTLAATLTGGGNLSLTGTIVASNLSLASTFATNGANALTLTTTNVTNVTLPTTGTLATLAGVETFTNKTLTSPLLTLAAVSTTASFVAGTNAQGQGALTTDLTIITTASSNPSGVTLPSGGAGRIITVINRGANPVNVYPSAGLTIDALAVNTPISLPVNGIMHFFGQTGAAWYSSYYITTNTSNLSLGGTLTTGAAVTFSGANAVTFTTSSGTTNLTLPAVTDTLVTLAATQTLTNKTLTSPQINGGLMSVAGPVSAGTNAQGQGALTSDFSVITSAPNNPSGATLPSATQGRTITVVNKGANPVNVYPFTGQTIDALATNASISLPVNGMMEFYAQTGAQWYSTYNLTVNAGTSSGSSITRSARTLNTMLAASDKGNLIDITSGTFTQTFDTPTNLGSGWYVYITNSGTGDITLSPTSGTIDGLSSFILYTGEVRLVQCDGSTLRTYMEAPGSRSFSSTGTFVVPSGVTVLIVDMIGGGGGGGGAGYSTSGNVSGAGGTGGGGGGRKLVQLTGIAAGTSVTVTVGGGGTGGTGSGNTAQAGSGSVGGNTTFGTYATAYGGGGGYGAPYNGATSSIAGGSGGGSAGAGAVGNTTNVIGGLPSTTVGTGISGGGGAAPAGAGGYSAEWGGAGGGGNNSSGAGVAAGAGALWGAAGGGCGGCCNIAGPTFYKGAAGGTPGVFTQGATTNVSGATGAAGSAGAAATGAFAGGGGNGGDAGSAAGGGGAGGTGGLGGGGGGGGGCGYSTAGGNGGTGGGGLVRISWY